jgi:hypothetical protein
MYKMKTTKMTVEMAEKEIAEKPTRKKGQWKEIIAEVKKSKTAVKISDITRGQCWALKRAAKDENLDSEVVDKSTAVIVLPPKKEK